ncbi:MAG: hypothetical protein ACR2P7_00400 [bacterium]
MKTFPSQFVPAIAVCAAVVCDGAFAQGAEFSQEVGFASARLCMPSRIEVPAALRDAPRGDPASLPIAIEADRIDAEALGSGRAQPDGRVTLHGDARIVQGRRGLYAERIRYDRQSYRAEADGAVVLYTAHGDEIRADALALEVDTFVGEAENVRVRFAHRDIADNAGIVGNGDNVDNADIDAIADNIDNDDDDNTDNADDSIYARARATALHAQFDGKDWQRLHRVALSSCAEGNQDVVLRARDLTRYHTPSLRAHASAHLFSTSATTADL